MAAVASIAAGAAGYVWEDPGDSIMIQISLGVVERLGAAVRQGLGAGPRGNEIGGVLFGRALPGFVRAVVIEDFELTPCEHLRGASYTLSPKDRRSLAMRLERRPAKQVVGCFRSHTRPGMYLDQDDFAVFSQYFPDPSQVFLLVRPSTDGPAMGGFFFWENGEVDRRATYRQFPFDTARLATGNFPITGARPAQAPAPPRPAPVLVAKPEARAHRKLPPLPWVVVPVIAVLFLIAGLFVSQNEPPETKTAVAKAGPPVEPLLPEPAPQAAVGRPTPFAPEAARPEPPVAQPPATQLAPKAALKAKAVKNPLRNTPAQPRVAAVQVPAHLVEQPPALAAPVANVEPKLPPVLSSRTNPAPPPEADVTYEPAHHGVFRRALHKLEGTSEAAASPVRKVLPLKPADSDAGARPVDVKVFIDEAGDVTRAQLMSKDSDLASAALAAARQWRFTPARKHDRPVSSEMVLHFRF